MVSSHEIEIGDREDSFPALLSSVHQLDTFHEDCSFEDLLYNIDAAHNDIVKWR